MAKTYSEEFKRIIDGKVEGVDYIIVDEKEPLSMGGSEYGTMGLDFTDLEIRAHSKNVLVGNNNGVYSAFDPVSHTMIVTMRDDMIDTENYSNRGLYVPFSNGEEPADPMKAAALIYQREIRKAKNDFTYGQVCSLWDHSDEIAFLKATLPTLKSDKDKEKITHLIEKYALWTANAKGYQAGRNDKPYRNSVGQKLIISLREKLDKKEIQALALRRIKWEEDLPKRIAAEKAAKLAEEVAKKKAEEEAQIKKQEEAKKNRFAQYKKDLEAIVSKKEKDSDLRDALAEKLKEKRRKKTTLLDRLLRTSGRKKAMKAAEKFHEENPTQKTALRFGSPKKSGRG